MLSIRELVKEALQTGYRILEAELPGICLSRLRGIL